jgi:DnaJ-class molecular chaperone
MTSWTWFFNVRTEQTCPKCEGSGQEFEEPCPTCHGKGTENKTVKLEVTVPERPKIVFCSTDTCPEP